MNKILALVVTVALIFTMGITPVVAADAATPTDTSSTLYRATRIEGFAGIAYIETQKTDGSDYNCLILNEGEGYIEVQNGYEITPYGVILVKQDPSKLQRNIQKSVGSGNFLENYDLEPGTYKLEVIEGGQGFYAQRMRSVKANPNGEIIDTICLEDEYLTVEDTDTAVYITGLKITKVD